VITLLLALVADVLSIYVALFGDAAAAARLLLVWGVVGAVIRLLGIGMKAEQDARARAMEGR
jgi:hypothetical protein